MNRRLAFFSFAFLLLSSCSRFWTWADYMAIHKDGLRKLEVARQINAHYGEVDNFIVEFGSGRQPMEWQTETFFDGRFVLTYVQPVTVDYSKRTVTPAGDPKFYLNAAESILIPPTGGGAAAFYDSTLAKNFGWAEWDKFVASGFDLTSLGIPKDQIHPVPHWKEYMQTIRRDRVAIK